MSDKAPLYDTAHEASLTPPVTVSTGEVAERNGLEGSVHHPRPEPQAEIQEALLCQKWSTLSLTGIRHFYPSNCLEIVLITFSTGLNGPLNFRTNVGRR